MRRTGRSGAVPQAPACPRDKAAGEVVAKTSGIAWKTRCPSGATARRPSGTTLFVTTEASDKLLLLRLDKSDGQIVWTRDVGSGQAARVPGGGNARAKFHDLHNLASPSPRDRWRSRSSSTSATAIWRRTLRRQAALEAQPAGGLRRVHDLVGPRQQPRAGRRPGDLRLHAGFADGIARRARRELSRRARQAPGDGYGKRRG